MDSSIAGAILVLAAGLRFYHLGSQSIWNDEIFSLRTALAPVNELQYQLHGVHPPLFFFLLHLAIKFFGTGEAALRLVSAIAGTITPPLLFLFARRFFRRTPASLAALALALSPLHIVYSQEARPYALAGLLALVSANTFLQLLENSTRQRVTVFVLTTVALMYTHHWGVFVFIAETVMVLLNLRGIHESRGRLALIWLIIVSAYIPEIPFIIRHTKSLGPAQWFWVERPGIDELFRMAEAYAGGYFKMASSTFGSHSTIAAIGGVGVVLLFVLGWITSGRSGRELIAIFTLSLALPFIASFERPELFLWYRYPVIFLPVFWLSAAGLFQSESGRRMTAAASFAFILVTFVSTTSVPKLYTWEKANVKAAVSYLNEVTTPDIQFVVRPGYEKLVIDYYYRGAAPIVDETYLNQSLGARLDTAKSFAMVTLDEGDMIRDAIEKQFDIVQQRVFPGEARMGLRVGAYKRKPDK